MTDREVADIKLAETWVGENGFGSDCNNINSVEANGEMINAFLAGLKAGKDMNVATKWHKYSERPGEKINALCFDIGQNKFILGFYDLEADEWLRYGGYETINIDLWTKIEIPEFIKE